MMSELKGISSLHAWDLRLLRARAQGLKTRSSETFEAQRIRQKPHFVEAELQGMAYLKTEFADRVRVLWPELLADETRWNKVADQTSQVLATIVNYHNRYGGKSLLKKAYQKMFDWWADRLGILTSNHAPTPEEKAFLKATADLSDAFSTLKQQDLTADMEQSARQKGRQALRHIFAVWGYPLK